VPDIVLRGIPDYVHQELKTAAQRNHRSLNGEILERLTASVHNAPVDAAVLLERIRHRHETLGKIDLGEASLQDLRDAGRP